MEWWKIKLFHAGAAHLANSLRKTTETNEKVPTSASHSELSGVCLY